jgi:hypothetical protein
MAALEYEGEPWPTAYSKISHVKNASLLTEWIS